MARYLVTNFAYGTGPFLRTTELAIAFNNELERRGRGRLPVIIPLVYGEKQQRIMLEEFGAHAATHPGELLLDEELGRILKQVFYTGSEKYEAALRAWLDSAERVGQEAQQHLSGTIAVTPLEGGEEREVNGQDIALELNRSPRIRYGVAPSYSTTFGYIAEIVEKAQSVGCEAIDVDPELLKRGVRLADSIEGDQAVNAMAYPATFSYARSYAPRYAGEILVPPITDLPRPSAEPMEDGLFVTITGIEGLERLYREARELGLKLYSNDPEAVAGAEKALPHVVPNKAIKLQFARAGWGSIWLSMFCGTPLVVPEYDPTDDPEIYFNNQAVESLGIGTVYRGQPLADILAKSEAVKAASAKVCSEIDARWGTLNGNEVCARLFADTFLSE